MSARRSVSVPIEELSRKATNMRPTWSPSRLVLAQSCVTPNSGPPTSSWRSLQSSHSDAPELPNVLVKGQRLIVTKCPMILRNNEVILDSEPYTMVVDPGTPIRMVGVCDMSPEGKVRAFVQVEDPENTLGWCTVKNDEMVFVEPAPIEV
eukprot:GEMP01046975.1.p1 GENE.GEMP01046975.1~~GEMP01046975.1.p1  ORF type:complete len:150 (+),score=36.51 GEMP01046975.1:163-612(+)